MTLAEMLALRERKRWQLEVIARNYGVNPDKCTTNDALRLQIIFAVIEAGEVEDEEIEL